MSPLARIVLACLLAPAPAADPAPAPVVLNLVVQPTGRASVYMMAATPAGRPRLQAEPVTRALRDVLAADRVDVREVDTAVVWSVPNHPLAEIEDGAATG